MTNGLPNVLFAAARNQTLGRRVRKPVRPTLDISHGLTGNLQALFLFGDAFSGPVRQISSFPSVFATGNPGNPTFNNFSASSLVANNRGGTALQFNGSNTFVDWGTGYFAVLGSGPWSVFMRYMFSAFGGTMMYEAHAGFNNFLWGVPANGSSVMGWNVGSNAGGQPVTVKASWSLNVWYSQVITFNGSHFVNYIDGALDNDFVWGTSPSSANFNTQIGRVAFPGTDTSYFNGRIEQCRVWKPRLLGPAEAAQLFLEPYAGIRDAGSFNIRGVPLFVRGTITERGTPASKIVRAYDPTTGALINSTTSAGDGTYAMDVGTRSQVYVAAFDPTTYKAQVYDRVTPVP